ncbi:MULTISPECIES: hypothetical protein [unclassified Rhodococcus (in: high G+C Gram-positive bacteria)]|uniref:hypothetical protein n=1 Tax=unclassified Rhodococcus (in: high G+C Gram-positive bacteria) TaxID=192944 RepID=UPI00113FEBEF|nr:MULTISPECIES: hypothetical protein [unclassified Rhodococcus (in: high G+C Gram-positive bacteria)]
MCRPRPAIAMELAPRTELYESDSGFVLRTADDEHFALALDHEEFDQLAGALTGTEAELSAKPKTALSALLTAGHIVSSSSTDTVAVLGCGSVAAALVGMLGRVGMSTGHAATRSITVSDDGVDTLRSEGAIACFREGNLYLVVPEGVRLTDVSMRRAASRRNRQRIEDGYGPRAGGRRLISPIHPVSDAAAEFVAAQVLAEVIGPTADHCVTAIDLRTLRVTRHPILPVPEPPR